MYVPNATATNAMAIMTVAAPENSGTEGAGVGVRSDKVLSVGTKYACRAQTSAVAFHETWLVVKVLDVEGAIIQYRNLKPVPGTALKLLTVPTV